MTFNLGHLRRIFKKSQHSAGPRYTPAVEPGAPNIEIEELESAMSGLLSGPISANIIDRLALRIEEQFTRSNNLKRNWSARFRYPTRIVDGLKSLSRKGPNTSSHLVTSLKRKCLQHERTLRALYDSLWDLEQTRRKELENTADSDGRIDESDSRLRQLKSEQHELREYLDAVVDASNFLSSPACAFLNNNCGVLLGSWGSGKTHFLCDKSKLLLEQSSPVLFVLAKDFPANPAPAEALTAFTSLARTPRALIKRLDALGRRSGQRALLVIDGINESDNFAWKNGIEGIISIVRDYPYVGLLISCRSPFQNSVLQQRTLRKLVLMSHPGFHEIEFDAQSEFFKFYKIPLPEVPLLAEEFSKPLTLKIMCGAFLSLPQAEQRKGFHGISSGQRGMTYILERYIKARSKTIEQDLSLPLGTCWKLIKGDNQISDDLIAGVAPFMAATLQEFVPHTNCIEIIASQRAVLDKRVAAQLYTFLVEEGILQEDEVWRTEEDGGPLKAVRLPYQRFGDHIVSRFLLSKYLDTTDESSIRRSFYRNKPIGKIFNFKNPHFPRYAIESWAEAIIVEFPERVKNALRDKPRELIYYLPSSRSLVSPYAEIFISGLFWRSPTSFCRGTDNFVGHLLWHTNSSLQKSTLDALVSLGTKYDHPYSAARLLRNLIKLTLVERDLVWSEFIRTSHRGGAIDRILVWFEHRIPGGLKSDVVKNLLILLALFLTTTDRYTRDRVTKVLVMLGEKYPSELFEVTKTFLVFNDVYVPERLLAACYGTSMSLWHNKANKAFHKEIVPFARYLTREIFAPGGSASTTHLLLLDYASGVIEIAQKCQPRCIASQQVRYIKPPYTGTKGPFPASFRLSKAKKEKAKDAIRMDFGNYTLGRLCKGRANYQYDHPGYKKVRGHIEWRILNLGYDPNKFDEIDREIGDWDFRRGQSDAGKVDRYGKKYSWISYFELYGVLNQSGELDEEYPEPRPSDSDIDPSFPIEPPSWGDVRSQILNSAPTDETEWLRNGPSPNHRNFHKRARIDTEKGPWILLSAYITDRSEDLREITSFARGYFVAKADLKSLRSKYLKCDYPGNEVVDVGHEYYTFAGEASWSRNFGFHLRSSNGKFRSPMKEAFVEHVEVTRRVPIAEGWRLLYEETGETLPESISPPLIFVKSDEQELKFNQWFLKINKINRSLPASQRIQIDHLGMNIPSPEDVERGFRVERSYKKVEGIKMMPTTIAYCWESYHSKLNQFSGFQVPHPFVCDKLQLHSRNREIELFDNSGNRASMWRKCRGARLEGSEFSYLRKDLLDRFLKNHNLALVWLTWGERGFHYDKYNGLPRDNLLLSLLQSQASSYRHLSVYRA